jgi:hypothetical protein
MKPRPDFTPRPGSSSVRADEVLSLREFGRRLGLAARCLCDCQRQGLRTVLVGRVKFVLGSDALDWFRGLAERQAGANGDGGPSQ